MDIRAVLIDFDGTALQRDQVYISPRNMHAIQAVIDKGIEVIPSTGRSEDMFPPQIEKLKGIRYWVTSNGARVVDRQTKEVIYQSIFTPEESAMFCRIFEGQEIYSEIAANGFIYMEKKVCAHLEKHAVPPHHVWFLNLDRQIELDKPSEFFIKNEIGIEKVNLYGIPKKKQRPIIDALQEKGIVTITEGAGTDVQFFPKRLDRTNALDVLFERLGINFDNVMSIGDSDLDLPAIKKAGIGVAMENAPDHVKEHALYVTGPFHGDGVAQAIEKYIL